jgi:hypothetical protein
VGLYYGDYSGNDSLDLIEAVYDPLRQVEIPHRMRNALANAYPPLLGRFPTYKSYSEATMEQILAVLPKPADKVEARTLASMVFFNRTNHFEAVELPYEAQIAPAFAVNVGDFDGDGRVDLAVSQNGAETKLYQNVLGKPGLRVRLAGPPGNPDGVGATMRLMFGGRLGAAREVHGGSGYWSQDSVVQVMGCPETPTQIWVRWPGGKTTTSPIPTGAKEIAVDMDGKLTVNQKEP